jgi:hypothetical protein
MEASPQVEPIRDAIMRNLDTVPGHISEQNLKHAVLQAVNKNGIQLSQP